MQIFFESKPQFEEKASSLAALLDIGIEEGRLLMARLSGYASAQQVQTGAIDFRHTFSREELIARLQSERPDIDNDRAAHIVDGLALPTRDARLEDIPQSPDAAPNIGA